MSDHTTGILLLNVLADPLIDNILVWKQIFDVFKEHLPLGRPALDFLLVGLVNVPSEDFVLFKQNGKLETTTKSHHSFSID